DITDLGELGRLDLDERRAGELGQAAGDLRLADAGRADHENIFRQILLVHLFVELLPAPAIAQGNGDGALGVALADDVPVKFGHDLAGGDGAHLLESSLSMPSLSWVSTQIWAEMAMALREIVSASRSVGSSARAA